MNPSDCGADTACKQFTCTGGVCGSIDQPQGKVVANPTIGDCKSDQCDANGNIIRRTQNDDTDKPNDNQRCTSDVCTNGVPSRPAGQRRHRVLCRPGGT